MKACVVRGFGEPPAIEEIDTPVPGPGELRVKVAAAGLNFADLLMLKGDYQDTPDLPFVPGLEIAGVVEAVGAGVTGFAPGARVAAFTGAGGFAEAVCVAAARCVAMPDTMSFADGAAFPIAYGTSHLALTARARLRPGERLVVMGAGGGVGLTAVELGRALGAEVIAVARGDDKRAAAAAAGAAKTIEAGDPDLVARIKAMGGADVVYDAVGGDLFEAAMRITRPGGRILCIGFASGTVPRIRANHLLVKNIDVLGVYWGGYLSFAPEVLMESLGELMTLIAEGRIAPVVGAEYPLEAVAEALDALRGRAVAGKIVLRMG